jgi:hypothetical protein
MMRIGLDALLDALAVITIPIAAAAAPMLPTVDARKLLVW